MNGHTDDSIREDAEKLWMEVVAELEPTEATEQYPQVNEALGAYSRWSYDRTAFTFLRDSAAVAAYINLGIPVRVFERALERGVLRKNEIELFIRERTYRGRKAKGEDLSLDESDRFARLLQVLELATETFGSTEKAHRWLRQPKRRFGGESPLSMLNTSMGAQAVQDMLVQIAHGVAA